MKNFLNLNGLLYAAFLSLFVSTYSCSPEQVVPSTSSKDENLKISIRSGEGCNDKAELVKQRVSERDHILYIEILTCVYYAPTIDGKCEYHLTTLYDGNKVYIIGDDNEGY